MKEIRKEKINKNTIPEGFSLGLAIYDAFPVLFFCASVILLGSALKSLLFLAGGLLCIWAGMTKVIWKIFVVVKRKNIWWMFMQMRICMPIGFLIMIVSAIGLRNQKNTLELWRFATEYPVSVLFIIGLAGLFLMGIAASKLDSSDAKANWIEQTINMISQFSILMGVIFLSISVGFYHADETALHALESNNLVTVSSAGNEVVFTPRDIEPEAGLIFYPGGKVEYTAYAPLMQKLAENGIACVLVEMPLNYAFLGYNAADDVIDGFPEIRNWYLTGHSLGGAFGSYYAAEHTDELSGVILLGSYSTKSLINLPVLSIYGSEDGVIDMEKYLENRVNLPDDLDELKIEGGNHAMFGSYGTQDGDGDGKITSEEQWSITAEAIYQFICEVNDK